MGRFEAAPSIAYQSEVRDVSDRFGLRNAPGPAMDWSDRARFLLTRDHSGFVLERAFVTGTVPQPDSAYVHADDGGTVEHPAGEVRRARFHRRVSIVLQNLRRVPSALREGNMTPVGILGLAALGALLMVRSRHGRARLAFLSLAGVASLAPALSHLESRFFYPLFSLVLISGIGAWAWLRETRLGRPLTDTLLTLTVLVATVPNLAPQTARLAKADLRRAAASWCRQHLAPGPILALGPGVPYWSQAPYRAIPMAAPEVIHEYARSQGAVALAFEESDLARLPMLEPFRADPVPQGFRLVHTESEGSTDTVRIFAIEDAAINSP
jgi:hypothetical protein